MAAQTVPAPPRSPARQVHPVSRARPQGCYVRPPTRVEQDGCGRRCDGRVTADTYDADERVLTTTAPGGHVTRYDYTAVGKLKTSGGRDVSAVAAQPPAVEPVGPLQGGELDVIEAVPGAASSDQLGLEQRALAG